MLCSLGSREADKDVFENSGLVIEENSKQSAMESSEISDIKDRSKITTLGEFIIKKMHTEEK